MKRAIERRGVTTSFVWGFSEATLFFFVPDIAVGAVALFGFRRGMRATAAAVAGAVAGGLALYVATLIVGADLRDVLGRLPAIPDRFFAEARAGIDADGGRAFLAGPGRGIPYKVYALEWTLGGHSPAALVLWTIPARAIRIGAWALLAALGGALWRRWIGIGHDRWLLSAYAAVWVGIYAAYFNRVGW